MPGSPATDVARAENCPLPPPPKSFVRFWRTFVVGFWDFARVSYVCTWFYPVLKELS